MIQIEVSPGELIDRFTILEIKLDRIHDAQKRRNVETEHAGSPRSRLGGPRLLASETLGLLLVDEAPRV